MTTRRSLLTETLRHSVSRDKGRISGQVPFETARLLYVVAFGQAEFVFQAETAAFE
jgi:hypothetical protein